MNRTPWFSVHKHLPVRAGVYEWRCDWATDGIRRAVYNRTGGWMSLPERPSTDCRSCQWRGLVKGQR